MLKSQTLVLARDAEGNSHAFFAVCTHQGRLLPSVAEGTISCTGHYSKFDVTSGEPVGVQPRNRSHRSMSKSAMAPSSRHRRDECRS
ncbi:Rieske 2Fe-2S domain-containing protein [Kribbella sp. CA-253562]|uniref:Rieske 2Fe-2S domain-containing protein n=1 Tax=Kribbella sp. CA-253562 TaxID=3239942 RepID=UPI003D900338